MHSTEETERLKREVEELKQDIKGMIKVKSKGKDADKEEGDNIGERRVEEKRDR